jgi:hypothetical protein
MKKLLYTILLLPLSLFAQINTQYIEQDRPLNLAEGWNMIGFTCNEPIDVVDAFLTIVDKVFLVKDNNGDAYFPEFGFNGIGFFEYGYGYQLKLTESISDFQFCPFLVPLVEGCMDETAFNYSSSANMDDGTCYPFIHGCLDPNAYNFNDYDMDGISDEITGINEIDINSDDGSCFDVIYGCLDTVGFNYNDYDGNGIANELTGVNGIDVNTNDGSCIYYGCTDPNAFNYESDANTDDGSCIPVVVGCTDSLSYNYNVNANIDDDACIDVIYGCLNPSAYNYNSLANTNDGTCIAVVNGCTDELAFNYYETANTNDGSCIPFIYGCTDATAFNYSEFANTDDGSCYPIISGCLDESACNYSLEGNTADGSCEYPELGYDCDGNIVPQYQVGDLAQGGIIFQINEDGTGLVSALENLTEGATDPFGWGINGYEWGCSGEYVVGDGGTSIGTGYQNTMDIVNQGCATLHGGITAAQAAIDAEINGYSDWYLPSRDELTEMYNTIGQGADNVGGFVNSWYWSSSETNNNYAWRISFSSGYNHAEGGKTHAYWVRPIRAFGNSTVGCMDVTACNFNSEANMADGSCEYPLQNYDCDGNFIAQIEGFTFLGKLYSSSYYISNESSYWSNYKTICENLGGHLATISSIEENSFITQLLENYYESNLNGVHIGLSDEGYEGIWYWITNEESYFLNWASGEPNNNGGENYAEIYLNGLWNDLDGNSIRRALLEIEN